MKAIMSSKGMESNNPELQAKIRGSPTFTSTSSKGGLDQSKMTTDTCRNIHQPFPTAQQRTDFPWLTGAQFELVSRFECFK